MKPATLSQVAAPSKWEAADEAFARGQQAYLDWCREIAALYAEGKTTQEEIAGRYVKEVTIIKYACRVGQDNRLKVYNINSLPKSTKVLYELTTLPDKDFEELCKPTTTQDIILKHKRRIAAPKPAPAPTRPPCPGEEGDLPGQWGWSTTFNQWVKNFSSSGKVEIPPEIPGMTRGEALALLGLNPITEEAIQTMYRKRASQYHPDREGGDAEMMAKLNQAMEVLK